MFLGDVSIMILFPWSVLTGRKMKDKLEEKQLVQWEKIIAENYNNSSSKAERNSVAGRVKASMEK